MWIKYMATALRGIPDEEPAVPDGILALRVDPLTGIRADNDEDGIYEYFYHENPPPEVEFSLPSLFGDGETAPDPLSTQVQKLFQPDITLPAKPNPTKPGEASTKPTENPVRNPLNGF
jgi:penicillin-binding protein 1A